MISRNDILRALTRGYAHELNRSKEIDIDLIEAMTDEIMVAISAELQRAEYYRKISASKEGGRR